MKLPGCRAWKGWLFALLLVFLCLSMLQAKRSKAKGTFDLEGEYFPPTPDAAEPREFYYARLIYDYNGVGRWGFLGRTWMIDSPRADRHFLEGVRRLTNVDAASMEKYVRPKDPDFFDYPWLYAVEPGQWTFTEEDAALIREYLARGGMLVVDDFHGTFEWSCFVRGLRKIIADRPILEIQSSDPVFHTFYDLDKRFQVPGLQYLYSGRIYELDGYVPHWRGVYDDKGRLMVVINFNMDLGDSWEHADFPPYAEKYTALGYRLGINYVIYDLTH
jgi:hypothetical protein